MLRNGSNRYHSSFYVTTRLQNSRVFFLKIELAWRKSLARAKCASLTDILFDCSLVLDSQKIWTVLQSM